jgi:hypothetical protein
LAKTKVLGHYSVVMTERCAYLKPDLLSAKEMAVIPIDPAAGGAAPVSIGQASGRTPKINGVNQWMPQKECRSRPASRGRYTVSDGEQGEGSTALDDSGTAERECTGDRLERTVSSADWPRNGLAASGQLVLPGMTPDLFLAAGNVLAARADVMGLPADQVAARLAPSRGAGPSSWMWLLVSC